MTNRYINECINATNDSGYMMIQEMLNWHKMKEYFATH